MVSNGVSPNATSNTVTLTVNGTAPSITTQPASVSGTLSGSASFTVAATGTGTLSYQWYKAGTAISGATSATLSLTNLQLTDAASYSVTVTGTVAPAATSNTASLTVTQGFTDWATAKGLTGTTAAATATPAGDGITNLVKFAHGLDPLQPVTSGLPTLITESGQQVFRFTRPNYLTGVTYTVQTSPDLVTWTASATAPAVESSTATTDTLKLTLPTGQTKLFVRLLVSQP